MDNHIFDQVMSWQKETFGTPNPDGIRNHLKKELQEILDATDLNHPIVTGKQIGRAHV